MTCLATAAAAILVVGDSIALGWGVAQSQAWPNLVELDTGRCVHNASVSGASAPDWSPAWANVLDLSLKHFPDTLEMVDGGEATVVIALGTNCMWANCTPHAYGTAMDDLLAFFAGRQIIIVAPFTATFRHPLESWARRLDAFRAYCVNRSLDPLISCVNLTFPVPWFFLGHPTPPAHEEIAEAVKGELREVRRGQRHRRRR